MHDAAGAFVAGVPLQPIVLRYDEVGHIAQLALPCQLAWASYDMCMHPANAMHPAELRFCAGLQGTVSPAWESISAPRHILLMLCHPFHSLTIYKACPACSHEIVETKEGANLCI